MVAPTTGVLASGADEVSAAMTAGFSGHVLDYQAPGTQMAGFHQRFVQALDAAGGSYAAAEAANASPCRPSNSRCSPLSTHQPKH